MADGDCNDGDGCTADRCQGGACAHDPLTGAARVACGLDALLEPDVCPDQPIDRRLGSRIALRAARIELLVGKATVPSVPVGKRRKLLHKAVAQLRLLDREVRRGTRRGWITPACNEVVRSRLVAIRAVVGGLSP